VRLNQGDVGSTDLDRAEGFYSKLGLNLIVKNDHYLRFECPTGDSTFSVDLVDQVPVSEQVVLYFESDDIDGEYDRLCHLGIEQPPTHQPWLGQKLA
jgi:catechol 2,3-dioxygenase-like lactoylglutathione lyase family enzyme